MRSTTPEFAREFHALEEAFVTDLVAAAPREVSSRAPVELTIDGPVVALRTPELDHMFFNRTVLRAPLASADELDRALGPSLARTAALGVTRHLLTLPEPAPLSWLERRGLVPFRRWIALARDMSAPSRDSTTLSVVRASPSRALEIGELATEAFALPAEAAPLVAALVGRPGWHAYAALDQDEVVAIGMLFLHRGVGYLGFGATRESHRGRGAQTALIRRRIEDARALGCRALFSETGEPNGRDRQSSEHNLRAHGFEPFAIRHNYAPRPAPAAAA